MFLLVFSRLPWFSAELPYEHRRRLHPRLRRHPKRLRQRRKLRTRQRPHRQCRRCQAPPVTAPATTGATPGSGVLHGHITDQTGALIPGAQVTVSAASSGKQIGPAISADAAGGYSRCAGLPAGSYVIQANFQGFAPFVSTPIQLAAGRSRMSTSRWRLKPPSSRSWSRMKGRRR